MFSTIEFADGTRSHLHEHGAPVAVTPAVTAPVATEMAVRWHADAERARKRTERKLRTFTR